MVCSLASIRNKAVSPLAAQKLHPVLAKALARQHMEGRLQNRISGSLPLMIIRYDCRNRYVQLGRIFDEIFFVHGTGPI